MTAENGTNLPPVSPNFAAGLYNGLCERPLQCLHCRPEMLHIFTFSLLPFIQLNRSLFVSRCQKLYPRARSPCATCCLYYLPLPPPVALFVKPKYRPRTSARIHAIAMQMIRHHHLSFLARRACSMPLSSCTLPASVSCFTFSVCCSVC